MTRNTLLALYENHDAADAAARTLRAQGIADDKVSVITRGHEDRIEHHHRKGDDSRSFADKFRDLFSGQSTDLEESLTRVGLERTHAQNFAKEVREGRALLVCDVDDHQVDPAAVVMDRSDLRGQVVKFQVGAEAGGTRRGQAPQPQGHQHQAHGSERTVPEVEESVEAKKRPVSRGGARVRTRVEERPVEEDVRLREERVDVQRQKVDRPVEATDEAFRDEEFEVTSRGEELDVQKRARVTGEVSVGKEVTERTEHVSETERRQTVEVEELPAQEFQRHEPGLRAHFDRSHPGERWEDYRPAYELGLRYARDEEGSAAGFDRIEPDLRRRWEARGRNLDWHRVRSAALHGYEQGRLQKA